MSNAPINEVHYKLSEITDDAENIYEVTRQIAGVAKRIKEEDRENPNPRPAVLKAIEIINEHVNENKTEV
jgi:hypothetical protein